MQWDQRQPTMVEVITATAGSVDCDWYDISKLHHKPITIYEHYSTL